MFSKQHTHKGNYSIRMFSAKMNYWMLNQMVSGVRGRWCLQWLLLSRGINFPLGAWSERGDQWEQTPKIYDVDSCNFNSQLNFLFDGAVLPIDSGLPVSPPQTQRCCDIANHFCGQGVAGSVMRQSSHEQGTAPVPWDRSSVWALSPGRCLLAHREGHLLYGVPLGMATACPSPAGTNTWIDVACIGEILAWLLGSPVGGRASCATPGEETIPALVVVPPCPPPATPHHLEGAQTRHLFQCQK